MFNWKFKFVFSHKYENDIQEMKTMLEQLWEANNSVLEKLAAID